MDKVRFGVVGCGGMGSAHIKFIKELPEAELVAVCDSDEEVAKKVAQENNVKVFSDYHELIDSGLIDAIVIATPHYFHPPVGIAAFEKGLNVLTEKPIAVTVSEADKFVKAAKKSKKVFAVMYQQRTVPAIKVASQIIKDGKIGEIKRTLMVEPNYRSQAYYDSGGWRGTWKGEGGGVLINQAPHGIDLFIMLAGLPSRVIARTRTRLHKIEVEDEADALLEYPNGAWGYYYTSTCETPFLQRIEISGDKGKLEFLDTGKTRVLKFYSFNPSISVHSATSKEVWQSVQVTEEPLDVKGESGGHKEIIQNFCAAILHGEKLIAPGMEGISSIEFINALNFSSRTCRPVKIPVSRSKYDKLLEELKKNSMEKHTQNIRVTDPRIK